MGIHWQELIVILLIVLVLFGPKRLPEMGSSLGKGIRGFREGLQGLEHQVTGAPHVTAASVTDTTAASATPVAVPVPVEIVEPATGQASTTGN